MRFVSFQILALVLLVSPLLHGAQVLNAQTSLSDDAISHTCSTASSSERTSNPGGSCCAPETSQRQMGSCCSSEGAVPHGDVFNISGNCSDSQGGHCCSCCQDACYRVVTSASPMWLAFGDSSLTLNAAGTVSFGNDARVVRPELPEIPPPKA